LRIPPQTASLPGIGLSWRCAVAVCRIAHSQKLTKHVAEEELDLTYRNEADLTASLMGLLAEESLIAQRLGRKKAAA